MALTESPAAMDDFAYRVLWKSATMGNIKDVDPSGVKPVIKEKKIARWGDVVIDRRHRGATGSIKTTLHQPDLESIKKLCPWWTSGAVPGTPAGIYDELANAGPLLLHPYDLADSVTTHDFNYVMAFPVFDAPKADGNWREIVVTWNIYPDPTKLANGIFLTHYYGPPPTE